MKQHLVAAFAYAGMILVCLAVAVAERLGRRAAIRGARLLLTAWVVGATLLAGLSQRDLWPLSSWSLMTGTPTRRVGRDPIHLRLAVATEAGAEYPVDYRAVEPFAIDELVAWMRATFDSLPPSARDSAAGFILGRLNAARARVRRGESPGTQGRWLGPLRAPYHTLHPARWTSPASVPAAPFVTLRIYNDQWDLLERASDPARVTSRLVYQYHHPVSP